MDQVRFGIARLGRGGARVALLSPQSFPDEARDRPIRTMNDALHAVAREAEIPFLDRHQLMTWWASSRTLYPDELLGEDALHMADRSYECLAIRLVDLIPALSLENGLRPRPDEQPKLRGSSRSDAPLLAGS
jgi:acyl-CoA thioesterase-1